jgi:DNA modification methylase
MTVRILLGDCRDVLRSLPAESVQTVVTSPPYWGLRNYGVEPSIWGGDDDCGHAWGDPQRTAHANAVPGPNGRGGKNGDGRRNEEKWTGPFCRCCGAWRGAYGLEPTYPLFVEHTVEVFREVRRVLRADGTLWLNIGDSYATGAGKVGNHPGGGEQGERWRGGHEGKHGYAAPVGPDTQPNRMPQPGLKTKDMVGIPWRVAFALQADGWYLRQDVIWSKPNPMPESVVDRCTKAHEYLFMFAKSGDSLLWRHRDTRQWVYAEPEPDWRWRHRRTREERATPQDGSEWARINLWRGFDYYFDQDVMLEAVSPNTHARLAQDVEAQLGSARVPGKTNGPMKAVGRKLADAGSGIKNNGSMDAALTVMPTVRNKRSVWEVTTQPFSEAHFATFPPALIEPCIKAGCPTGGGSARPVRRRGHDRPCRRSAAAPCGPDRAQSGIRRDGGAPHPQRRRHADGRGHRESRRPGDRRDSPRALRSPEPIFACGGR